MCSNFKLSTQCRHFVSHVHIRTKSFKNLTESLLPSACKVFSVEEVVREKCESFTYNIPFGCVCVCVSMPFAHVKTSRDSLLEFLFSYHMGPWDLSLVTKFVSKHLYSLHHFASPVNESFDYLLYTFHKARKHKTTLCD